MSLETAHFFLQLWDLHCLASALENTNMHYLLGDVFTPVV